MTDAVSSTHDESSRSSDTYDWTHLYRDSRAVEPIALEAEVVHGFKRGSKELGIPTANLKMEELGDKGSDLETGIYYGISTLNGVLYDAVMSVGWNPFYKNTIKTIEVHLMCETQLVDFYGERLNFTVHGYLRPEANFKSLGECYHLLQWPLMQITQMYLRF
jgi:riboflavin kinase